MKQNYCDFPLNKCRVACEKLQEIILLCSTDLDHMFVFTFASALQLINHPFLDLTHLSPGNAETFSS